MFNSHVGVLATLEILDSRIPGAAELVGVLEYLIYWVMREIDGLQSSKKIMVMRGHRLLMP